VATQKRVAKMYFDDGSIAQACPPLKALLHIMLHDEWEGKGLEHAEFRKLFTRENLLASDWYAARLKAKQAVDRRLWKRHADYLNHFMRKPSHEDVAAEFSIAGRLADARKKLEEVESPEYLKKLSGTLGAEPIASYL
jgi:phosphoenolpyruvate carboxykinase (diphosphate)